MKKVINITANLYDPGLLKDLVEKLACRHEDLGYNKALVPGQWKAIETAGIQAYIMGTFDLRNTGNQHDAELNVPFTSCFLFTCIKEKEGDFELEWSSSLS